MHTQHAERPTASRHARRAALLVLPGLAACDTMIGENAEIWLAISLVGTGVIGGLGMFLSFLRRFGRWDHADSASGGRAPESFALGGWLLVGIAGAAALGFTFYNWFSDIGIPPDQQWWNIGAWCAGTVVGGFAAYLGGRRLAFKRHQASAVRAERARSRISQGNV